MIFDEKFWLAIAFVVFILLVLKLAGKTILNLLDEKSNLVKKTIDDARKKMESVGISQIPIFDGKEPKGVVTEQGILSRLADSDDKSNYKKTKLEDIMETIPAIVTHDTPVKSIVQLIRTGKFLLVSKDTKFGIITASNALNIMDKN